MPSPFPGMNPYLEQDDAWHDFHRWAIGLRDRLPVIPVPLTAPDGDAQLDLQDVLHHVYDASGYEDYIYEVCPNGRFRRTIRRGPRPSFRGGAA